MITDIKKGDTITLTFTVTGQDITSWKIRCELFDNSSSSIKLATANSSGADTEIEKTDAVNGEFKVYVPANQTTNFKDRSKIEIEVDTGNIVGGSAEILTIYRQEILFDDQQITWTDPNA